MKNTKINLADVKSGQLSSGLHIKVFKKLVGVMKAKHTDAMMAVPFFLKLEQEFDKKATNSLSKADTDFLLVLGTRKSDWKLYIKDAFKEDPKNMLAGTCFIEGAGDDLKFILQPMRGQAGLSKIQKAAKGLFKTAKLDAKCIELGAELPLADEEGDNNDSDFSDDEEFDDVEDQLEDAADDAVEAKEGSDIEPLIKDLQQFQQGLKALVDGIQNAKNNEEAYAAIGGLYAAFGQFEQKIAGLKKVDAAHPAVAKAESNLAALRKMAELKFGKMIEFMNKVKAEIQKLDQMLKAIPNYAGPSLL